MWYYSRIMGGPNKFGTATAALVLLLAAAIAGPGAALLATLLAPIAPAVAAGNKRTITVKGDFDLGVRLLRDAGRIRYVEPYLDTGPPRDLHVGRYGEVLSRMYFVNRSMSSHEIRDLIDRRSWQGLLGYVPKRADTTPGYIVGDPRWAPLVDKCPNLFPYTGRTARKEGLAPERMRLLRADIDNNGVTDTVRHSFYPLWPDLPVTQTVETQELEKIDFERCTTTTVIYSQGKLAIFTHDGEQFIERYPRIPSHDFVHIFRPSPGVSNLDVNYGFIIGYDGIHRLTDYAKNPKKYRIIQEPKR